jgi:hypothetical protein
MLYSRGAFAMKPSVRLSPRLLDRCWTGMAMVALNCIPASAEAANHTKT